MMLTAGLAILLAPHRVTSEPLRQAGPRIVRSVSGRDVEVVWPARDAKFGEPRTHTRDGRTYAQGLHGEVLDPAAIGAAWTSIAEYARNAPSAGLSTPSQRRFKVFIVTRADILNRGDHLRPRRATIDKAEIEHLYQSLARAGLAIEAKSAGTIRATFDVEIDSAEDFEEAGPGATPFDAAWLDDYLAPRINGHDFKSDDKVYRGPWDAVWVVHAGLVDRIAETTIASTPCRSIPFFAYGPGVRDAALAEIVAATWEQGIVESAVQGGYASAPRVGSPNGFYLNNPFPIGWLASTDELKRPHAATWVARRDSAIGLAGTTWAEVQDDPFLKLRRLSLDEVSTIAGSKIETEQRGRGVFVFAPGAALPLGSGSNSLDGAYSPGNEASAIVRLGSKSVLFVETRFAPLLAGTANSNWRVHGLYDLASLTCLVFTLPSPAAGATEWQTLGLPETPTGRTELPTLADPAFFGGRLEAESCIGYFKGEASNDAARPSTDIRQGSPIRQGGAVLFDGYKSNRFIDARQTPVFRFWLKATNAEPILIRFESESPGWPSCAARLFGRWPTPEDGAQTPAGEFSIAADGEWHEVAIDVRALQAPTGQMRVRRIWLESDPLCAIWGADVVGSAIVTIGPAQCEAAKGPTRALEPIGQPLAAPDSTFKDARARWAASATESDVPKLIDLLKDRYTLVRINAAATLGKFKGTAIEAALAESLNTLDPRLAEQAMGSLRNQGTEYAWGQIVRYFNGPPADGHRYFALKALESRKDSRLAGSLTAAYASPSWRTRNAGVQTIAALKTPDASTLLMVFLQESNPRVRQSVVESADMGLEKVCRRILYTSVNDASEYVRAASLAKLMQSSLVQFRDEGYKGVRDESRYVRMKVLEFIAAHPNQESRQSLQIASVDADPDVKCAALRAWATFPGDIRMEELGDIPTSIDPRVQSGLAALMKAKSIKPSNVL